MMSWLLLLALLQLPGTPTNGRVVVDTIGIPVRPSTVQTAMDTVPDRCSTVTVASRKSGVWSDPAVWGGVFPPFNAKIRVTAGTTVTVDDVFNVAFDCIGVEGVLTFDPTVKTKLIVGTTYVYPGGHLIIGIATAPVQGKAELVIANQPLDFIKDQDQYGTGLLIWGEMKTNGLMKESFIRVATEPLKSATTLQLSQLPVGWQAGDRLVLPDTRHLTNAERNPYIPQWEELTIAGVLGTTVTLTVPLAFDHKGARDGNGVLDFLPHVANLSRNVVIRSETPSGTRGHVWATSRANIDIRYTAFQDLGRTTAAPLDNTVAGQHLGTNQIGRYPLHMHHVMGPAQPLGPNQFTLIGNAIDQGSTRHNYKWGLAIHNSHYGLIQKNAIYNIAGAAIMTEDGSESFNLFDSNFVMRSYSDYANRGDGLGQAVPRQDFGYEASGFWLRGPNNRLRNNVAVNILDNGPDSAYGYKLFQWYLGKIRVPKAPGSDTMVTGQYTLVDGHSLPLLEFSGNEVYGATESGLTWWWLGIDYTTPRAIADSIIKDLKVWNVFNKGLFGYNGSRIVIDGMVMRGSNPTNGACCNTAIFLPDYPEPNFTLKRANIQGMRFGIVPTTITQGAPQTIENSYFRVYDIGIQMVSLYISSNGTESILARHVFVNNVKFDPWPGRPLRSIDMSYGAVYGNSNLTQLDELRVTDYQQLVGQNFDVFYTQQAPLFVMPATTFTSGGDTLLKACPAANLTNQQCRTQFGVSIAGEITTCSVTRPEITGFTCP